MEKERNNPEYWDKTMDHAIKCLLKGDYFDIYSDPDNLMHLKAIYELRKVYWTNVGKINELKMMGVDAFEDGAIMALRSCNRQILQQINELKEQL